MFVSDDTSAALRITRQSTADQVAALLRERIVRGELQPGTPLREVPLAASIGISRNTMREAIRALVHEGLVRHNVHRGVTVTKLTENDVADIYRVRRLLECAAVEKSTPQPKQSELLAESLALLDNATKANPNRKIFEARKRETAALGAGEKLVLGHPLPATIGDSARCMQNLEKVLFTGPKTSDTVTFICD